jgi:hypothetical protein
MISPFGWLVDYAAGRAALLFVLAGSIIAGFALLAAVQHVHRLSETKFGRQSGTCRSSPNEVGLVKSV